ncbi:MAG: Aldo/keto reductase [Lentinula lateritia]|nr:MAG: Aldo/keto reductase [Lentinula lateritia]
MPSFLTSQSCAALRDGAQIPIIGFDSEDAYNAVTWALEAGYRHIDSAEWYENERECGKAVMDFCRGHDVPRSSVFFTTKLKENNGYEGVTRSIQKSLDECGLGYIDLYLIHGPIGGRTARLESWRAICEAHKSGKLRNIGISTFGIKHLQEILDLCSKESLPLPSVHQIDLHPFQVRSGIVEFNKRHGIVLEAWAPLILLRFCCVTLYKGYVAIPKSSSKQRIISNIQVFDFELSDTEILNLDGLDETLVTDWDPTDCD